MATFADSEFSNSFNQCRVHANMGARRIFLPLRGKNTSLSQPRLLARADIGNAGDTDCGVIVAWGGGDSQKRRITVPVSGASASSCPTASGATRRLRQQHR